MPKRTKNYTHEFRDGAVDLLRTSDQPLSQVARELGSKASHSITALSPRLLMFGVESLRGATLDRCLSIYHLRRESLPSSNIEPVRAIGSDTYRTGFAWVSQQDRFLLAVAAVSGRLRRWLCGQMFKVLLDSGLRLEIVCDWALKKTASFR